MFVFVRYSSCMETRHGEIGCLHPVVHGHGKRRRRCARCGATWTIWKKRRGRKPRKRRLTSVAHIMRQQQSLTARARRAHRTVAALSQRYAVTLTSLNRMPWPVCIPSGPLLLVIDALWFRFQGMRWTAYLMAVRSVHGEDAVFLRPVLRQEWESAEGWGRCISDIPCTIRTRIQALISDSIRGIEHIAADHGWVLQRCHFHLMARLHVFLGSIKRRIRWRNGRRKAYAAVQDIVATIDPLITKRVAERMRRYAAHPLCPTPYRYRLRETLRHLDEYRSYLLYPDLNLPSTTNVMESMNSRIRGFLGRARGYRTPEALERWLMMFVRLHHTMKCRKKNLQN